MGTHTEERKSFYSIPEGRTETVFSVAYRIVTVVCMLAVLFLAVYFHRSDLFSNGKFDKSLLTVNRPVTKTERQVSGIYPLQADAILKGQTWLDLEPSDALKALENPYDPHSRKEVAFRWDFAFYNNRYYCYFGVAPVLTLYLPFYALTGQFPSLFLANLLFAEGATLFLACLFWELRRFLFPRAPRWAVLLAFPCLAGSIGIPYAVFFADMYYLPVISAITFSFAYWTFLLRGLERRGHLQRFLFVLSALSLVLTVLSRPSVAVMGLPAIALLVWFLTRRQPRSDRIRGILAFGIPLLIGAACVMVWNFLRFGSPFDFGSAYQLTVGDISRNRLEPSCFSDALKCYYLGKVKFPYPELPLFGRGFPCLAEHRIFSDFYPGICYFPICFGILTAPFLRRSDRGCTARIWAFLLLATAAFVTWVDYCLAGINLRYILDLLPPFLLGGAACAFCFASERNNRFVRQTTAVLILAFLLFGVYVSTGVRVFNIR